MNFSRFLSEGRYLFLPRKNSPKVILNITSRGVSRNAFKIYNPFSAKARLFKSVMKVFYAELNPLFQNLNTYKIEKKSEFVEYLEEQTREKIITSLYVSTIKEKVVLQLQTEDGVLGYVKYPLNEKGVKHILNESKAIKTLQEQGIFTGLELFSGYFKKKPYIALKELKGEIGDVDDSEIEFILKKFKRKGCFRLENHPGLLNLQEKITELGIDFLNKKLNEFVAKSSLKYAEVFEHGDFAPWNIIRTHDNLIPFDFEYFEENGLEFFDEIKYYYQIGKLLKRKRAEELKSFVKSKVKISEFDVLFGLFLIKEIILAKEEGNSGEFECAVLNLLKINE